MISFKKTGLVFSLLFLFPCWCHAAESDGAAAQGDPAAASETVQAQDEAAPAASPIWANYYGIYYGTSLSDPSSYQATVDGSRDPDRPIFVKNFVTAGYDINPDISVAAMGYWVYVPVGGQQMVAQDPSLRVAFNQIIHTENFNWYADIRADFPVTTASRQADLLAAGETFHFVSYNIPNSRWTTGIYAKARYNYYGKFGSGNDLDFYFAPMANYQMTPKLTLTLLYEMGANHYYGQQAFEMNNDGTDFEPGVAWAITPALTFNPYFNIYTGERVSWQTTSVGASLSWLFL